MACTFIFTFFITNLGYFAIIDVNLSKYSVFRHKFVTQGSTLRNILYKARQNRLVDLS